MTANPHSCNAESLASSLHQQLNCYLNSMYAVYVMYAEKSIGSSLLDII